MRSQLHFQPKMPYGSHEIQVRFAGKPQVGKKMQRGDETPAGPHFALNGRHHHAGIDVNQISVRSSASGCPGAQCFSSALDGEEPVHRDASLISNLLCKRTDGLEGFSPDPLSHLGDANRISLSTPVVPGPAHVWFEFFHPALADLHFGIGVERLVPGILPNHVGGCRSRISDARCQDLGFLSDFGKTNR